MQLKTLTAIQSQRREAHRIPHTVQDIMPVQYVWEDGIFQVGRNQFSASYQFSDINYLIAGKEERRSMFVLYQALLSCLGPGAVFKITANNRAIDMGQWDKNCLLPKTDSKLDTYIEEYNDVIRSKIAEAAGITEEYYLTVTTFKPSLEEAKNYFNRIWPNLYSAFSQLGSKIHQIDAVERLRIFHGFFRPNQEDSFSANYSDTLRRGHDFRDTFVPAGIAVHGDYLQINDKFARVLFVSDFASYVRDDLLARLSELPKSMMVSVDIISIPTEETVTLLQSKKDGVEMNVTKWQQRQNRTDNFSAEVPYHLKLQREQMEEMLDEVMKDDQGLNIVTMTIVHTADSLAQLNADTERLKSTRDCNLMSAMYQQLDGLATVLPFGVCKLEAKRTLLTRCLAAVAMPFRVQEVQEPGGIFYGVNALTRNLIICNRSDLQNQGAFILGVPGSGKSMIAKQQIIFLVLGTTDIIMICDPEGEYNDIVKAMGGEVIKIKAGGQHHINAMDLVAGYGEKGGVADKSEYVQAIFEQMNDAPLSAQEQSVIDRCVIELYAQGKTVTLMDLRALLLQQPEAEGKSLALTLERFTTGSLDAFAHETNVDLSNRLISFDLSALRPQLRGIAQLTITDFLTNRINVCSKEGLHTHIFTDEIQEFFKNEHSAEFFDSAWRQWRKRGAAPTAITQNVSVLLHSPQATAMLSNSETVILLNQSDADQLQLSEVFRLPDEQMRFVRDSECGCGLLLYGDKTVPFINRFPKNTKLYKLMTTKLEDGFGGNSSND